MKLSRMNCVIVKRVVTICAVVLISTLTAAQQSAAQDVNEAVVRKLNDTTADFNYDREDFSKIIDDVRERFDVNVHVSWPALDRAGVKQDTRVTIQLKQVSLGAFLDLLLREAAGSPEAGIGYFAEHGILVISTEAVSRPATVLKTYDITDLIESGYSIRRFANTPTLTLELTGREFVGGEQERQRRPQGGGGGGAGGGGGSIFGDPGRDPERGSRMERIDAYVNLIEEYIHPESWVGVGGDLGSIRAVNNTLFIRHTAQTQLEIASLLEMLRNTKPKPVDADAAVVQLRKDKADEWRKASGEAFPVLNAEIAGEVFANSSTTDALFRSTSSGYNGERLWFSAVSQREVLSDVVPVVGGSVNAFNPQKETATQGLELIVLPLLSPDGERVNVDVQFAWIPTTKVDERSFVAASAAEPASIDVTERTMRTVSTAARVNLGQTLAFPIPQELGADHEYEQWLVVRVRGGNGR